MGVSLTNPPAIGVPHAWKHPYDLSRAPSVQVLGVPLTPDFSAVGLAYFAQAICGILVAGP